MTLDRIAVVTRAQEQLRGMLVKAQLAVSRKFGFIETELNTARTWNMC
jgi:hypothetical protein